MTTLYLEHLSGRIAYNETGGGPLVICVPSMGDVRGEYRWAWGDGLVPDPSGEGTSSLDRWGVGGNIGYNF